jgi:glycosyltransferase involved in cell wall biosynthesis
MPARNAGTTIRAAIESVLGQEAIAVELVVVDDGSRDDTAAVAESIRDPRLTVLRNPIRRGIAACHNLIVRQARAPYIAHADADDVVLPGALRTLVDAVAHDPGVGLAHCYFVAVDAGGRVTREAFAYWWRRQRSERPAGFDHRQRCVGNVVWPALTGAALHAVEFDERLSAGVDYDMTLRIADHFRIVLVPAFLCVRRLHDAGATDRSFSRLFGDERLRYRVRRRLIHSRSVTLLHARDGEVRGLLRVSARPAWQRLQTLAGRAAQRGRAAAWRVGAACAATLRAQLTRRLSRWPLAWRHIPRPAPSGPPRVIYYLRVFPILSETFIQREVAALLELGMSLEVLAEEARGTEHFDEDAHRMAARTTYLGPPPASSSALWFWLLRRPLMLLNTIAYVRLRTHTVRKSALGDRAIIRRALRLARLLRQYRATHIHAPWSGSDALAALLAAHLAGIRYSVQARASDLHKYAMQPGLDDRLGHADFVITNAHYNVPAIRAWLPATADRDVHVIYEGVDSRRLVPTAAAPRSGAPTILSVARLVEPKGIDVLLRACRILKDAGTAFHCVIVGGRMADEVNYYVRVRKLWRALSLQEDVEFLGAQSFATVRTWFARADLCVLAAMQAADGRRDVTPNSLIEAMALGLPIVSTRSGAIPELIEDGVSGVLVAPNDERALAAAMADLLGDEERRRMLGAAARRRVEERFDILQNAARYAEVFTAAQSKG